MSLFACCWFDWIHGNQRLFKKHIIRKTKNNRTTPAIPAPTIAALYPSDSGNGEIEVAIVSFEASDVVKDVIEIVAVVFDVSRVSDGGEVFFVVFMCSILVTV